MYIHLQFKKAAIHALENTSPKSKEIMHELFKTILIVLFNNHYPVVKHLTNNITNKFWKICVNVLERNILNIMKIVGVTP